MLNYRNRKLYLNPNTMAAQRRDFYAAKTDTDPEIKAMNRARVKMFGELAQIPQAIWIGDWLPWMDASGSFARLPAEMQKHINAAKAQGNAVVVFVTYLIMGTDGDNYSAGGVKTLAQYKAVAQLVKQGLGGYDGAWVIIEPDAISLSGSLSATARAERNEGLRAMVDAVLEGGGVPFLDAGDSDWIPPDTQARRLIDAGARPGVGAAYNVAHYETLKAEQAYAKAVEREIMFPLPHVIDGSRVGARDEHPCLHPHSYWANVVGSGNGGVGNGMGSPADRVTLRPNPVQYPGCMGVLYVKDPCKSDGEWRGAPKAGQPDDEGAVDRFINAKPAFHVNFDE